MGYWAGGCSLSLSHSHGVGRTRPATAGEQRPGYGGGYAGGAGAAGPAGSVGGSSTVDRLRAKHSGVLNYGGGAATPAGTAARPSMATGVTGVRLTSTASSVRPRAAACCPRPQSVSTRGCRHLPLSESLISSYYMEGFMVGCMRD